MLYRADQEGTVYTSAGPQRVVENTIGEVKGEPYKWLETDDPEHLYLALSDGTIVETTIDAKAWSTAFSAM